MLGTSSFGKGRFLFSFTLLLHRCVLDLADNEVTVATLHMTGTMKATDISSFATSQLSLLNNELQAELAETQLLTSTHAPTVLQRAGLALLNLSVSSQRTGLGGKTLLELGLDPAVGGDGELPEHGLRVGDICAVAEQPKGAERKKERESKEKQGAEGVLTRVQREAVTVALDKEEIDIPGGKLWLYVLLSTSTRTGVTGRLICSVYVGSSWQTMSHTSV